MKERLIEIDYGPEFYRLCDTLEIGADKQVRFQETFSRCMAVIRPKAVYGVQPVTQGGDTTYVGGSPFTSWVMRYYYRNLDRTFPYVITCGREMFALMQEEKDPEAKDWLQGIARDALKVSLETLMSAVRHEYDAGSLRRINPGSTREVPLSMQPIVFGLLNGYAEKIGVELDERGWMWPDYSGAGFLFESEEDYVNCIFCEREGCPGRHVPLNRGLAEKLRDPDRWLA